MTNVGGHQNLVGTIQEHELLVLEVVVHVGHG